jgi:hypothetical protein
VVFRSRLRQGLATSSAFSAGRDDGSAAAYCVTISTRPRLNFTAPVRMATIGPVTKREDGRYEGELKTLPTRAEIAILPASDKVSPNQPDYCVMSQGHRDRRRLAAHGIEFEQGGRLAFDRGPRVRCQDALRQPRSRRWSVRPRRLRADLEPARLRDLLLFAIAPAKPWRLSTHFPLDQPPPPAHPRADFSVQSHDGIDCYRCHLC